MIGIEKKIMQIAIDARNHFLSIKDKYNTDDKLSCMCAIASNYLFLKLKKYGINSSIYCVALKKYSHCFLMIEDYILDITASQFGEDPIIYDKFSYLIREYWDIRNAKSFDQSEDFIEYLKTNSWSRSQIP